MKQYAISELARQFSLSRSTLLYYERIGLLRPARRSPAGYRAYTETERRQLGRICRLHRTGLTLEDLRPILAANRRPGVRLLQQRLQQVGEQIRGLQEKQRLLGGLLKQAATGTLPPAVDKAMWVELLRAAGLDDPALRRWHAAFERRAPAAHHAFLLSLGIPEAEAGQIRAAAAEHTTPPPSPAR